MATSDTTYGQFPGVRITVTGGGISNARIGREQKLVLFGRGDTVEGEADPNDPVQIRSRVDATDQFGSGTRLTDGIEKALENKGNHNYIYGVAYEEFTVSAESITGGSGTLENAPIVEDAGTITAQDITESEEASVEFRYESPPSTPNDGPTVFINPLTGEIEADDGSDYEIDYAYGDWESALDAADPVLNHAEVGVYAPLSDSSHVADRLAAKLSGEPDVEDDNGLRGEYKLAMGVMGAQPTYTTDDGDAAIDVSEYGDSIDNDAVFLAAPVRRSGDNSHLTIIGGLGGLFAGNALENPIYGDPVHGYGPLSQELSRDEQASMRTDHQVIPVVDDYRDGAEGITIQGHLSTSTATDWDRTYQNRRLTDLVILMQRRIGESARDNLMRDQQLRTIENKIITGFERLARAGLIHGSPDGEDRRIQEGLLEGLGEEESSEDATPYFAEAVRSDTNTIAVSSGFVPVGVTTAVDGQITVSDAVDAFGPGGS